MSSQRTATIVAPIGAAGMLLASLAPYLVLATVSELISENGRAAQGGGLTVLALIGLAGACLLAAGMVLAARQRLQPTPPARMCLLIATGTFGLAVPLIGYGNTQLMMAFRELAMMEVIEVELFLSIVNRSRLPMFLGYVCVLVAAVSVFWAGRVASPEPAPTYSASGLCALIVAVLCLFPLCLATLWTAFSVYSFEGTVGGDTEVFASEVAASVSGTLLSVYLSLVALMGYSLVSLLCALAKGSAADLD
jgi:hypothetical protein